MTLSLRERLRAGLGTAEEWLGDRNADLARGAAELEAQGHRLYGEGLRKGRQVVAKTTSELREFAKDALGPPRGGPKAERSSQANVRPTVSGKPQDRAQQILDNARRITGEIGHRTRTALHQAAESEPAKKVAGDAARAAGNAAGVVTGGVHMAHDLYDGTIFLGRLLDVTEPWRKPAGEAAWDGVAGGAGAILNATKDAILDPSATVKKATQSVAQFNRETDPRFTPAAPTLAGEVRRNFGIGRRQGEVLMEVAPYLVGAGEVKATAELGALSKASLVEKYLKQGFTPRQAAYLAEPYKGMGHHSIAPRRATLPDWLGGGPIPKRISDSSFNVLAPPGMSRGDFYELHYKVDPHFKGTRLPGGGGWSGKKLGLQEYGDLERIWYGTPTATKRAVAGVGVAGTMPVGDEDQP
jgi:hypothetical protein